NGSKYYPQDNGSGIKISAGESIDYIYINVAGTTNADGLVFKPQLEVGKVKTDFEPNQEPQVKTATEGGTVSGITSVSPNMTLISTNENVVINAEYISKNSNADTEKIAKLNEAFANAKAVIQKLRM
ncbi:MAG: hypothetical protein IKV64_02640, partial [Clostridia bacterium]|nr:hypothetical protein [Clostridia bacterium]